MIVYVHTHTEFDIAIIQAHCYIGTTSEPILMSIYSCVYAHFTRYYCNIMCKVDHFSFLLSAKGSYCSMRNNRKMCRIYILLIQSHLCVFIQY